MDSDILLPDGPRSHPQAAGGSFQLGSPEEGLHAGQFPQDPAVNGSGSFGHRHAIRSFFGFFQSAGLVVWIGGTREAVQFDHAG